MYDYMGKIKGVHLDQKREKKSYHRPFATHLSFLWPYAEKTQINLKGSKKFNYYSNY